MLLTTAALCLAINIYHEARGESLIGQHAVAQVTMNRAARDPKNVCQVVTERRQFSWTTGLVKNVRGKTYLTKQGEPQDEKAWRIAQQIARVTLSGAISDFTKGAKFYHAKKMRPYWSKNMTLVAVFGGHFFYRYV